MMKLDIDQHWDAVKLATMGSAGVLLFAALAFGLGTLAITTAVAAILPSPRPRVGLASLALAGLGMVVVGAFPTDPIDPTDPRFLTTAGAIHAVAGILSFTCFALAAPLLTRPVATATHTPCLRRLAVMAATFIIWLLALAISVRRVAAPEQTA